jgi:hypothetical protein
LTDKNEIKRSFEFKNSTMPDHSEAMKRSLQLLKELRGPGQDTPPRLAELKRWQSLRLARTYADVAVQPRLRAATSFFLDDLYGPKDFSGRDQAMMRIVPVMSRILPASAVETAALAIELEALSEDLDQRLAKRSPRARSMRKPTPRPIATAPGARSASARSS